MDYFIIMDDLHCIDSDSLFSGWKRTYSNNEINFINNDKIYEPEELNTLLLYKTKEIVRPYNNLRVIGDITYFKKWKCSGCTIDIAMNRSKINCKVFLSSGIHPDEVEKYLNTRCIITGALKAEYFNGHKFSIVVNSIEILNNVTKLKEFKSICEDKGYFKNKKKIEWNIVKNIGIISKKNTQGYDDFCSQFNVPLDITLMQISLEGVKTSRECIEAIKNLQNKDLIIITRGGGDTGEISNAFDHIELFDIIKNSKVPIITAIGHEKDKGDKLLITNVSDLDFATPTTCAKDLNNKFYTPLIQIINNLLKCNEELFYELLEKNNDKLYEDLKCQLEYFIKSLFCGKIIKVDNDEINIIVEKNGKYYKNILNFDDEMKFIKQNISLKYDIDNALKDKNIAIINDKFNKLNTNKYKFSSNIQDNILKINKNEKINDKFLKTNANINTQYYLKRIPRTKSLNNLIKIRKILLWYKKQIKESMNGKVIDEIENIYNFIKNHL